MCNRDEENRGKGDKGLKEIDGWRKKDKWGGGKKEGKKNAKKKKTKHRQG
jgi:hypothetical protein